MKGKLQNTLLRTLQPREKPYEVFDIDLAGFLPARPAHGRANLFLRVPNEGRQARAPKDRQYLRLYPGPSP